MAAPFSVASRALAYIDAARLSIQLTIEKTRQAIDASHKAIAEANALLERRPIRERGA